jgi:mannose-6-phosphate isomerase-like protein (cupin superfamily)
MIVSTATFFALSNSSSSDYFDDNVLPDWPKLRTIVYCGQQVGGYGAEPHFHDNDEFWFFTSGGTGEAWLDRERFEVGPNTIVYTPKGIVHRFQMFASFGILAIRTRLEGQRRPGHLHPPDDGQPRPTDRGMVVPGDRNIGMIVNAPDRCPVRELRLVSVTPDRPLSLNADSVIYIVAVQGAVSVDVDGQPLELQALQQAAFAPYAVATTAQGDLLVVQPNVPLRVEATQPADVVLIRE